MKSTPDLSRSLGFLLADATRLFRKRFDQRAQALGMTRAQWQVIVHLYRCEGITQKALSELLEIEPITLARHIDRLEGAGWVERRPHPGDRRANLLFLTDKVAPIFAQMQSVAAEVRAEVTAGMSPEQIETLLDTLTLMKNNLQRVQPTPCCVADEQGSSKP
ncbi:MAG: MarR family transcriptional regulator [Alphaproteobacteria bacterium CG_4_10_14_0_2_um_filter_63_37]|nr:MAG: hypothetical protein AUJ55_06805 [Proteobacteria bacterium CG1_02_64_396]PJA24716.1 MAG: MarR family transcriptional regulator [Alphaproteobacteria bacterium CG_4_10_14_0_2_um_filter_63_37]